MSPIEVTDEVTDSRQQKGNTCLAKDFAWFLILSAVILLMWPWKAYQGFIQFLN